MIQRRDMDYTPPPIPPQVPAIHREFGEVGGLTRSPYMASNEIIAQMPEFLRQFFRNKKIERPRSVSIRGESNVGAYGNGRVQVSREAEDVPTVARHELLHALSAEHPRYRAEPYFQFGRLRNAVGDGLDLPEPYRSYVQQSQDWPHAFVHLGNVAMTTPDTLPLPVQNYFAPLLPPVQPRRGPF